MNQGSYHDPFRASIWASGPSIGEESKPSVGAAIAVGVGTTAIIATAMYFLGGRELPKLPTFGETEKLVEREVLFGRDDT
jgi:hypothetical protein